MSVNRNSNIIKAIKQPNIGPVRYEFPATLHLGGGGGGAASGRPNFGGVGAGGSTVVSASLNITPNVTYYVEVGGGGIGGAAVGFGPANGGTDGEGSFFYAYTDNYDMPVTMSCEGGQGGSSNNEDGGGNSGTGSVEYTTIPDVQDYPGFNGGATISGDVGGQPAGSQGGGAGSGANGQDGNADKLTSGDGGAGILVPSNIIDFVAGGGGGGACANNGTPGDGTNGGGNGGDDQSSDGTSATKLSAGGGGGGSDGVSGGAGGNGADGFAHIRFIGIIGTQLDELDITVTNATVNYDAGSNTTDILFNSGSGTLRYTAPYPYVPKS